MLQALLRTITELLDSKKAAYSFLASVGASVLHLYFGVSVQDALLLVSPLGLATVSQAHVDAAVAKSGSGKTTESEPTDTGRPQVPVLPTPAAPADGAAAAAETKTGG
ncbi:MAG TPA: hypothetical protein VLE97_11325 [Gaiellaceae bacterium]|nr:hypothetical protein [Gaiellaceae bacterium]